MQLHAQLSIQLHTLVVMELHTLISIVSYIQHKDMMPGKKEPILLQSKLAQHPRRGDEPSSRPQKAKNRLAEGQDFHVSIELRRYSRTGKAMYLMVYRSCLNVQVETQIRKAFFGGHCRNI